MSQPPKQLKDRDWLFEQYVTMNKSASQIGRELGCQQETVSKWLHKFDIELRPHGQDVSGTKSGLYGKKHTDECNKRISQGVIKSFVTGKNKRWTKESRKEQSIKYSGVGNPRYGAKISDEQKERQRETLMRTFSNHPEIRRKISDSLRKYHALHPEAAKQHSEDLSKYYDEHPEYGEIQSNRCKSYYIEHPLTEEERKARAEHIVKYYLDNPDARKIHSDLMKIKNPASNPEVAHKISESMKNWHATNPIPNGCGQCCGRYYTDSGGNKIWLRSSYETRYAGILDTLDIMWTYEQHIFRLPKTNSSYHPDFYLPEYDLWVEVKGYIAPAGREKMKEFRSTYPDEKLIMVYLGDIENIEYELQCYAPISIAECGISLCDQIKLWDQDINFP